MRNDVKTTPKGLVKAFGGLARCADKASEFSVAQLRALAKLAEDYGKVEFRSCFLGELQARRAAERKSVNVTPGSMLEALQSVGGVAAPYAWFSLTPNGRVVLHTWRSPDAGRMDGWHVEQGCWTLDTRNSPRDAPWRSLPQYTALLRALDAQTSLHGDVVFAAISTDVSSGVGPAKRKPGSNVLLTNNDGTPARFRVTFDLGARWHRLQLLGEQDCNVGAV